MRLDLLLVECGLVESRNQAQKLIMAGQVRVNDQIELKPSTKSPPRRVAGCRPGTAVRLAWRR